MIELFVRDFERMEELECEYNLEDCGLSGKYYGWHWFQDDDAGVAVYFMSPPQNLEEHEEDFTKIKDYPF